MDFEKKMNKYSFEIRFLLILALFPVIVVIVQLYYTHQNIFTARYVENLITNNVENQQWDMIRCVISENEKRARLQESKEKNISFEVYKIQNELNVVITNTYKDNVDQLNKDLDSHDKNRDCYKILKANIENMFMNVDSFDNRVYVADREGILVDRDTVKEDRDNRLWETEIQSNADPIAASKAVDMILLKDKHIIYWVAEGSEQSPKDKDYQHLTLESIRDDISENGIKALKSYDVLVPVYVPNRSMVLNESKTNFHGVLETEKKLIVIQSFNLYDAFIDYNNNFEKLDSTTDLVKNAMRETVNTDIITLMLVVILTLMSFGGTIYGAFLLIKWSAKDGNNKNGIA